MKFFLRICGSKHCMWLAPLLCLFVLAGCASPADIDDIIDEPEQPLSYFTEETVTADNILEFVTLGQYKGLEYDPVVPAEITESDIDRWITGHLSIAAEIVEITDRAVMLGDTVTIDYEGFLNEVAFPNGADTDFELVIGSQTFIPGFEEQIIGHNTGEQFDINVTFPENYREATLAGQDVVFAINLKAIHLETVPELTDDFVRANLDVSTVAEYRAAIRQQLQSDSRTEAENSERNQVWNEVLAGATVHRFPIAEIEETVEDGLSEFRYYSDMYGIELDALIEQLSEGLSLEEFIETEIRPLAINDVRQDLILRAVAAAEGIVITDDEFAQSLTRYAEEFAFESEEAFLELFGEHKIRIALIAERVIELVMSYAIAR